MRILIFSENRKERQLLEEILQELEEENIYDMEIFSFEELKKALECASWGILDGAFISVKDSLGHGNFLIQELGALHPELALIAVSESSDGEEMFSKLQLAGHVLGELTKEKVLIELEKVK